MCLEIFGLAIDAPPAPTARTLTIDQLPVDLLQALNASTLVQAN